MGDAQSIWKIALSVKAIPLQEVKLYASVANYLIKSRVVTAVLCGLCVYYAQWIIFNIYEPHAVDGYLSA